MDFHYDSQVRRYLLQFMSIFSDIKVRNGPDANGMYTIKRIPVVYGDPSSIVAQIIKGVSENTMLPAPMFSIYIDSIKISPERRADTQLVSKVTTTEREFNQLTQTYGTGPGVRYEVDRYMPVPYDVYFKLDCWTTNTTNKLQIFEQISPIFNPSIQLQQNNNILDWTSIFSVWMEDFTWTNRSIPQGGEIDRDIMSWKFKAQCWISPPAKVKKSGLIAEIITNMFSVADVDSIAANLNGKYDVFRTCIEDIPVQIITTEGNYKISVTRANGQDEITLLNEYNDNSPLRSWADLISIYGQITENITKIRLKLDPDVDITDSDIIGNIALDPVRKNVLIFYPDTDTLPGTTIPPISAIIDPIELYPGNGLPAAAIGQRYLLTVAANRIDEYAIPINVHTSPWGSSLVTYANDIIEFNGSKWIVIFDSRNSTGLNYVINNSNSSQYTYDSETGNWAYTYYGQYAPGYWRIDGIIKTSQEENVDIYE